MVIKIKNSSEFYSGLHRQAIRKRIPLRVLFELTHHCNFNCIHCYNSPERKTELTTSQVKSILDQLRVMGCFHVGFTGGEPLTRSDLFEILDYSKEIGFRITLLTNGFLIDEKAADGIASIGASLNSVHISLLGAKATTVERITGTKGSLERALAAIMLLRSRGVDVKIKTVVMTMNKKEIGLIQDISAKLGTSMKYSYQVHAKADGASSPLQYRLTPKDAIDVMRINEGLDRLGGTESPSQKRESFIRCGAGITEACISPSGGLKLCPQSNLPSFDILACSLKDAWAKLIKYRQNLENGDHPCKHCRLFAFCNSCPITLRVDDGVTGKCNQFNRAMARARAGI
jgi:radical SAM protein with 4Fe4S-binding SPASM domain